MKVRPTDLAQYELLHGQTEYPYDFPAAPSIELLVDIFADRPCSVFLHVRKASVDRWVPIVSGQRRIELRGRFSNTVGLAIHCAKEGTINALVVGNPVGIDPVDYTPVVMHPELPALGVEDKLRREFRAMLDARLGPPKTKKEIELDPELMGDEIPERAGPGFEIDDDDLLDPEPWSVQQQDEPARDPVPDDNRARPSTDRGSEAPGKRERGGKPAPSDKRTADDAPIPDSHAGGDGS